MSNQYVIKGNTSGKFFATGAGLAAATMDEATKLDEVKAGEIQKAISLLGGETTTIVPVPSPVATGSSFAVSYIRKNDLNADGTVKANKRNPSGRRFATQLEALQHGARFVIIEKHLGFYVTPSTDPVNSFVSKATGKTNPVIGKGRTNR